LRPILVEKQVGVDAELVVMFMFEIAVKAENLLPFDDGQR
jgi:hypothetical protein